MLTNIHKIEHMKNMLMGILFLLASNFGISQDSNSIDYSRLNSDIVLVRVFEVPANTAWNSQISVSDGKSGTQTIRMKKMRSKNLGDNLSVIAEILNRIKERNYLLREVSRESIDVNSTMITDYLFEKKE